MAPAGFEFSFLLLLLLGTAGPVLVTNWTDPGDILAGLLGGE